MRLEKYLNEEIESFDQFKKFDINPKFKNVLDSIPNNDLIKLHDSITTAKTIKMPTSFHSAKLHLTGIESFQSNILKDIPKKLWKVLDSGINSGQADAISDYIYDKIEIKRRSYKFSRFLKDITNTAKYLANVDESQILRFWLTEDQPTKVFLNIGIASLFGLKANYYMLGSDTDNVKKYLEKNLPKAMNSFKSTLNKIYKKTQSKLKKDFSERKIKVYRGFYGKKEISTFNTVSSWTIKKRIAQNFAGEYAKKALIHDKKVSQKSIFCYLDFYLKTKKIHVLTGQTKFQHEVIVINDIS